MRKNGVNREIRELLGNVSAVNGFRVNKIQDGKTELVLLACDGRYPVVNLRTETAFLTADGALAAIPSKDGCAKAVFLARGVANLFCEDGDKIASELRAKLAESFRCAKEDVLCFSSGAITGAFPTQSVFEAFPRLIAGLSVEQSFCESFSYAFDLGDFPVRIGGILFWTDESLQLVLTTDVKITEKMLEKAFLAAYRETFGLSRNPSPFDCAVALSSRKAENYEISAADGEYAKFADALFRVMERLLKERGFGSERRMKLTVSGGRSKTLTRAVVKRVANVLSEKQESGVARLFSAFAACDSSLGLQMEKAEIRVYSDSGEIVLMENGVVLPSDGKTVEKILSSDESFLTADLCEGNYSSSTWIKF